MPITGFSALSPGGFRTCSPLPRHPAWMSCHFSAQGLTDLPRSLPAGSLLILDDSTPPEHCTADAILDGLRNWLSSQAVSGLLLDFQRPGNPFCEELAPVLSEALSCPVAVTESYAAFTKGPVFLGLLPPHQGLKQQTEFFEGRELWMELGPSPEQILLTEHGASVTSLPGSPPRCPQWDLDLHCHYKISLSEDQAVFTLLRNREDLRALLRDAQDLGVTRYVGLYGELAPLGL